MIRGTTPTIIFNIKSNIDMDSIQEIWATFKKRDKELTLKLSQNDISIETEDETLNVPVRRIYIYMKQEHTLFFNKGSVDVQIRFLDNDNIALASKIITLDLYDVLKEGEINAN